MTQSYRYSGNVYQPAAGTTTFALTSSEGNDIAYLQRAHITVSESTDDGDTWTDLARPGAWDFDAEGTSVVLVDGTEEGDWIRIKRDTPYQDRFTTFAESSLLTSSQLNTGEDFSMYVDQELSDAIATGDQGALKYQGSIDLTVDNAPANPQFGDVYINTGSGDTIQGGDPGWVGIVGDEVSGGEQVVYQADATWTILTTPASQVGVLEVTGTAPITVDNADEQRPIIGIDNATTDADGAMSSEDKAKLDALPDAATGINLAYTAAAGQGTVTNTAGDDATIPFATATNAGLYLEPATPAATTRFVRRVTDEGDASWIELPVSAQDLWQRDDDNDTLEPATDNDNVDLGTGNLNANNGEFAGNITATGDIASGDPQGDSDAEGVQIVESGTVLLRSDTKGAGNAGFALLKGAYNVGDNSVIRMDYDGDITTEGDIQSTSINGAGLNRSQLINGNFKINQRSNEQLTVDDNDGAYWSDRWMIIPGGGTDVTVGLNTTQGKSSQSLTPSSPGSGKFVYMVQAIELPRLNLITPVTQLGPFEDGSTWTVSGVAYNALPSSIELTWSDSAFGRGNTGTLEGQQAVTSLGNNRFSATFTIDDSNFLDDTHLCLTCRILFNNIDGQRTLTEVQLEPGPVATPYEHRPIAQELSLCQRYYYARKGSFYVNRGYGSEGYVNFTWPTEMRSSPTTTFTADDSGQITKMALNGDQWGVRGYINATFTGTPAITQVTADAEF